MHLSILTLSILSLGQLAVAARIPDITISIDISTDGDTQAVPLPHGRQVRHGLQQSIKDSWSHITSKPTCGKEESIILECGKGIESTDECSTYCSCNDGKLVCPETEDCSTESIDFMCGDYAKCACSTASSTYTTKSVSCPAGKEPFEVECGKSFESTKDCPSLCSCGADGKIDCRESEDCDKEAVLFMCGADVAGCHC